MQFFSRVLHHLWVGWKRRRWGGGAGHLPSVGVQRPGGCIPGTMQCRVSCPQAQPQLFPSKPWPEPWSCLKLHSQASYDIPGKVIFSVLWKSMLISSDACRFHTFLCVCAMLNVCSCFQISWSYFNQQNQ